MRLPLLLITAIVILAGCATPAGSDTDASDPPGTATPAAPSAAASRFPAGAPADYQLGGAYPPPAGTSIVARDRTATPAAGLFNICYVNGFQTQPEDRDLWLRDRRDLLLSGPGGRPVVDKNWPDEMILDTSTPERRGRIAALLARSIGECAEKGFQAVEFDNLDSYSRSNGALTADNNLALAADLARTAHDAGLLAGQKNAADLGERAQRQAAFDFAVAEECLRFQECARYSAIYGERVIDIEYTDDLPTSLDDVCRQPGRLRSTIIRDRQLVTPGTPGYFYRHC
ncbi:endo alpha-1,4 polygalactosaminidase [Nocardia sp. NPDC058058]|uniref:endo alpha-1,4 polygalactosaminidase n=1 Tax=Nocardia sp. NPDC058058 TaxID=3346317 RepID=UPI0036D95741